MEKERDEAIKACLIGIEIEKNGYDFYIHAAERTQDPKGKGVLLHLAKQELKHERILADMIAELGGKSDPQRSATQRPPVFPDRIDYSKVLKDGVTELEVLKIALDMEHATIHFFTGAKKKVLDSRAISAFDRILAEEEKHVRLIEGEIDYLTAQGVWLGIREIDQDG